MKPLVEATVMDATGVMKATFFNQPWLERQYRPGTRLMLLGKYQGRNRFRVNAHARSEVVGAVEGEVSAYPATKGITSTQIAALVQQFGGFAADFTDPLPGPRARRRAAPRPARRRCSPRTSATARAGGGAWPSTSCCVDQIVQLRLRDEHRERIAAPRR